MQRESKEEKHLSDQKEHFAFQIVIYEITRTEKLTFKEKKPNDLQRFGAV